VVEVLLAGCMTSTSRILARVGCSDPSVMVGRI
jgi:hypothetical protein